MDDTEIYGVKGEISPHCELTLTIERTNGTIDEVPVACRLDSKGKSADFG
ncbi:hypothetical protein [Moraxella catarrhalis]|nr:hypothetical protein [Moraxella catarrhalis]OAV12421.1 hypothetical protein AO375_2033 [Moraxella catarrhalis]